MNRFISICLIICLCICLTGCNSEKQRTLEEKIDAEIEYLEDMIFNISNKNAKNEYIKENKKNWDEIKKDVQKIDNSWLILSLDLTEVNIDSEKIVNCSNNIDNMLISISNNSENNLLDNLIKTYDNIIEFKDSYTEDKNLVKKMKIKSMALKIYYYINKDDYNNAKIIAMSLKNYYQELMKDKNYSNENNYNINKVNVLIEEFNLSVQNENRDLSKMKYINLIERM